MAAKRSPKKSAPRKSPQKISTRAPQTSDLLQDVRREIWPDERQIMMRPERLQYVRKMIKPEGCVFCASVRIGIGAESLLIHQTELAITVLNKFPYNTGHLLVLPRRHCGEFLDLTEAEHAAINAGLQRGIRALKEAYQPAGFNVGLNLGGASGAGIPEHLHYHVIPRWNGDTNFFPLIAKTKVVIETLEQTFARLLPFFTEAGGRKV